MKVAARTRRTEQSAEERDRDLSCFHKFSDPLFFTTKKSAILSLLKKKHPQKSRILSFLLQKKSTILSLFTSKKHHPPKISNPLSFYFQKNSIPKISDPLSFYFQKNSILSLFTSKKTVVGTIISDPLSFTSKKAASPKISNPLSFCFQKAAFYLFLLPKIQRWVW